MSADPSVRVAFEQPTSLLNTPVGGAAKRWIDVVLALGGLSLLFPVFLLAGMAIWLTDGRPIFFSQTRLGFGGRTFECWKFRTMSRRGDEILATHLAAHPAEALEWHARRGKLRRDPRVTPVGRFLRKTSIDELPQLFNALSGTMSIVGPRPLPMDEVQRYGDLNNYTRVRPGLTGLWQVSGHHSVSYEERIALDNSYVVTWSLHKDFIILIKTLPALLSQENF